MRPRSRVAWRLLQVVPVILLATFIVFGLVELIPGDPAVTLAGENPTAERIDQIRAIYGLDQPFLLRYVRWLAGALHGDLSISLLTRQSVVGTILQKLPYSLTIVAGSILLSLGLGIPLGIFAAVNQGGRIDGLVSVLTSIGVAVPSFWLSMILVSVFTLDLHWFPATGAVHPLVNPAGAIRYATLPAVALASTGVAEVARQVKSALAEVLASQAVRTLHAKGLRQRSVLFKHGLRNIGVNLLTVAGLLVSRSLGSSVVIEAVFAVPGIGSLIVYSALQKDFPMIQGIVFFMVIAVVCTNLIVDSLYAVVDPRLRR